MSKTPTPTTLRCLRPSMSLRCSRCGRSATEVVAAAHPRQAEAALETALADLETIWLVPSGCGFEQARFCVECAPSGSVMSVECSACGDGPLAVGTVSLCLAERVADHLIRDGWQGGSGDGLRCPRCRAEACAPENLPGSEGSPVSLVGQTRAGAVRGRRQAQARRGR